VKVENDACTRERLDRKQPWESDGCYGRVSLSDIEPCVDTEGYWVEARRVSNWQSEKGKGGEPNMRMKAHVPSRTRRKTTGVRPQPPRSATRNLMSVRTKRTVSNVTKAALERTKVRIVEIKRIWAYAKMMRVGGERITVQVASKRTPGTMITRVTIMATFSRRKRTTSGTVTVRLRS
jgi:hypothetical protein